MHVVALSKLSCETPALLRDESAKRLLGEILATVLFLLSSPDMGQASPPDNGPVETEISSVAGYSLQNCAKKLVEDPFAEVACRSHAFLCSSTCGSRLFESRAASADYSAGCCNRPEVGCKSGLDVAKFWTILGVVTASRNNYYRHVDTTMRACS